MKRFDIRDDDDKEVERKVDKSLLVVPSAPCSSKFIRGVPVNAFRASARATSSLGIPPRVDIIVCWSELIIAAVLISMLPIFSLSSSSFSWFDFD
jgi:hypothetical protein